MVFVLDDMFKLSCVPRSTVFPRTSHTHTHTHTHTGEPSVVVNPIEHLVNRSDSALFVCKVEGSPLPTVQWAFADSSREFRFIDGKISKTEGWYMP